MTMTKRSSLALAVLALLEEAPMHPYRMQQLITLRGKDQVVNVSQRASLYTTIDRLSREGLVRVTETERDGQRPERSIYEITDEG
ncbi:MAG: PadR family transcriptional regulator, partial [Specibacter sp.]